MKRHKMKKLNKKEVFYYRLNQNIVMRREYFGGLVFNKKTGDTADVDKELFTLLIFLEKYQKLSKKEIHQLLAEQKINISLSGLTDYLKELVKLKMIDYQKREAKKRGVKNQGLEQSDQPLITEWPKRKAAQRLEVPETVHWAISYRCNANCPDCYARRHQQANYPEMNYRQAQKVIDQLVEYQVFQLSIGGGEPLIREDLPAIITYAQEKGLVVHLTSGLDNFIGDFAQERLRGVSNKISSIQLGIRADKFLTDTSENDTGGFGQLQLAYMLAREMDLQVGVNLILTRAVINSFKYLIAGLSQIGIKRITLLRYKPHERHQRWLEENVTPEEFKVFRPVLVNLINQYQDINFRLDCALGFLQPELDPDRALKAGIRGCVAADRILAIGPDGSVYPCSQLVSKNTRAGNILEDELINLYKGSKRLRRYRNFRQRNEYMSSICGVCQARNYCGGCRVFSNNTRGEDIGCPGPITGDLKTIGKYRRKGDLKNYFKTHDWISVASYMERYGVGQKRAVKELKNIKWLMKSHNSDTGRKKSDYYKKCDGNIIYDIQDSIGFTSGGFPYATAEEITEWIKDDYEYYPDWLKRINKIPNI